MDMQEAQALYTQAIIKEREDYLYKRALHKVRFNMRSMPEAEKQEYLQDQKFQTTLYQLKRRDKAYQTLLRGELAEELYQDEFESLAELIMDEGKADLPFLRSVESSHMPLDKAHQALQLVEDNVPRKILADKRGQYLSQAERKVEHYLRRGNFPSHLHVPEEVENVLAYIMQTLFQNGLPNAMITSAYFPESLNTLLRRELAQAHPELTACGEIVTPSGEKVSMKIKTALNNAHYSIRQETRNRFTKERIQELISENPSLHRLQKQAEAHIAKEKLLRTALLNAIPDHYRDLYPLARQMKRRFILHLGPTNSGKTYEGVQRLHGALHGIYLGPLRLLAAEQFETLNMDDIPCSLVTGEEQIRVPGSRVQSSTVEMADLQAHYDVAVIDECQMIADRDRGGAWTAAILGLCADEIHACASPDAEALLTRIITECGDDLSIVRHERMTPLKMEKEGFQFPDSVRPGDALIVFSKARVHAVAADLRAKGHRVSLIYGALPPDVRRDQAERFQHGETDVVVSTDAIAMGMNLPIQRVVFLEVEKFDGDIRRPLNDAEIKQIAGRAGRYGIYDIGYVNSYGFKSFVTSALKKPLWPLTEAVIRFPESLLGIPLPLTKIIDRWIQMQDKGCFSKASTERMATLAGMLETKHTDKELLYRFLCIPFDETDPDLLTRWRAMYHAESQGEHIDVLLQLPQLLDPERCTTKMLDVLEANYRRCDLYYNYARLFLESPDRILEEIQRHKDLISQGIIHILSTQKLQQKVCRVCKKRLPWNWPYSMCDTCYRQRYFRGGRFSLDDYNWYE